MPRFSKRMKHAWNAFTSAERARTSRTNVSTEYYGASYTRRPDRPATFIPTERSIISSIYTRLAIDVASVAIRHSRTDDQDRFLEEIDSGLNNCLKLEANVDQGARMFRQDWVTSMLSNGVVAVVPVDTTLDPTQSTGYDIKTLRVGKIVTWYAKHVRVDLYNEETGLHEEVVVPKSIVAISENPFYSIMNEPNSTLQRLVRKLALLDVVDEASANGKLDIIIQLPYTIKSPARRKQAEDRQKDIAFQLRGSEYGIAYADATEKITQLNRPAENNLMSRVEYLVEMLYGELGLTKEIMLGTADEKTMLNYWNRTIEPILDAMTEAMRRSFLTKTARSQKQTILYFRDPFKLVPIGGEGGIADIADKLLRNEVASSNEMRGVLGWKPSDEPKADKLINSNMPVSDTKDSSLETADELEARRARAKEINSG